jgi:succinoglycan biosynthesis protein ExoA
MTVLIVIPALNEARHIHSVVRAAKEAPLDHNALVVVVDGGSTDGTLQIVDALASNDPSIKRLHNPARIQSAGINQAVEAFGDGRDYLVRIDAHASYPPGYIANLISAAVETGATSVVVPMRAVGQSCFQSATAAAQNSRLGTGGAAHRMGVSSRWVDHGHHAVMRLDAFRAVGGYNVTLATNEDAELDSRLLAAGGRIWLSVENEIDYFPRATTTSLWKQYLRYGAGRATTLRLQGQRARIRQMIPMSILPLVIGAVAAPLSPVLALPALGWALVCLGYGAALGIRNRSWCAAASGWPATVMHLAWSCGYWQNQLAAAQQGPRPPSP